MRIGFVASELTPLAKTGGLADAVGALSAALAARGHRVTVVLPHYRTVAERLGETASPAGALSLPMRGRVVAATVRRTRLETDVTLLTIDHPAFFDRAALYDDGGGEYPDNAYRFAFFARAALEALAMDAAAPDVVHCHDWQAALAPFYVRTGRAPRLETAATLLTLHNGAYQGQYDASVVADADLDRDAFQWRGIEFFGQVNFLKGGLLTADRLNTVSPRYAREIQTPAYGAGLDGVFRDRAADLEGILNGADYTVWNPETDGRTAATYSAEALEGKAACRRALAARCGWAVPPPGPIFAKVSRLAHQKGADLLPHVMPAIAGLQGALVVLGSGEPEVERALRDLAQAWPERVHVTVGFDDALAHQILAGADALLMPSRFEPCGLTQLYALRYGTVPIVRATGGLADTIRPYGDGPAQGTGFAFTADDEDRAGEAAAFAEAIRAAGTVFRDPGAWTALMRRGMAQRFSWDETAAAYEAAYDRARAAAACRGPLPWQVHVER